MNQKTLITCALPYANGMIHFGHIAGAYLPGDCYSRFCRLQGKDTLFICGSDEYGVAVSLSAKLAGRAPQEHVDIFHHINRDLFAQLNIDFDHYSRTTWPGHVETTQEYFKDLYANGFIQETESEQLFSEEDQEFLADRYVVGTCPKCGFAEARGDECPKCAASYEATDLLSPRSKLTNAPLKLKKTTHWFLDLPKFKEKLLDWIDAKQWKDNVVQFIKNYIKDLRPRSITRDLQWGIPVPLPQAEGKVFYVWFDAPIGYISASKEWAILNQQPDQWKNYWCDPDTKFVQFVGKDNIPFHSVIFPAMTMGQNQPYKLVDELPANEFYLLEGRQFSKSDGWTIDLEDFFTKYSSDQIRYMIAATAPETSDSEFSWKEFQSRCNADLLGKFGNFIHRTLTFVQSQCQGKIPENIALEEEDYRFLKNVEKATEEVRKAFSQFSLRRAVQHLMEIAQLGNIYFSENKPWEAAKNEALRSKMNTTIYCCLICIKQLALCSYPLIPDASQKIWGFLGFSENLAKSQWNTICSIELEKGKHLPQPEIIFKKIEDTQIAEELEKMHASLKATQEKEKAAAVTIEPIKSPIDIDAFSTLDLRVGQIIEAVALPKSKKLFQLKVDLGVEVRTILSGIRPHYEAEQLLNKKVIVLANLKPAKLMGIESQGMILAGASGEYLELPNIDKLPNGSIIR